MQGVYMDFFGKVNKLGTKQEAVSFYDELVGDPNIAVEYAARNPGKFRQAMIYWTNLAGYGYKQKFQELEKLVESLAEPLAEHLLLKTPTVNVVECLSNLPSERLTPKSVLNKLKVPRGFILKNRGVFKQVQRGDEIMEVPVLPDPVLIVGTARQNKENVRYLYLVFRDVSMRWIKILITLEDIGSHHRLLALAKYGLGIHNDNKQKVMKYLTEFWNINRYDLPSFEVTGSMGWTADGRFVWPDEVMATREHDSKILFEPKTGFERQMKAFKKKGSWPDTMRILEVVRKYEIPMFALYHSLAGPMLHLLRPYDVKPSMLDVGAQTGTGKSITAKLYSWVYGRPGFGPSDAGTTWNKSMREFEESGGVFGSISMVVDDTKHQLTKYGANRGVKNLVKCIYAWHDGGGFDRLMKDGSKRIGATWWTNAMITGEESMNRVIRDDEGARARIVPIEYPPFGKFDPVGTGKDIKWLDKECIKVYGVLGRKWVEFLMKLQADADEDECPAILANLYESHLERLEAYAACSVGSRVAKSIAAALTAGDLACDFLQLPRPKSDMQQLVKSIMKDATYQANRGDRALRNLITNLMHHPHNVVGLGATENSSIWAAWPQKGKPYLVVSQTHLKYFLAEEGVSFRQTITAWMKNGYFLFDGTANYDDKNFDDWVKHTKTTERRILPGGARRTVSGFRINAKYFRDLIADDEMLNAPEEEPNYRTTPAPQEVIDAPKVKW